MAVVPLTSSVVWKIPPVYFFTLDVSVTKHFITRRAMDVPITLILSGHLSADSRGSHTAQCESLLSNKNTDGRASLQYLLDGDA